jgi:hypothetical protein
MPIRFALYTNPFQKDSEELVARVVPEGCLGDEDVLEMVLRRSNGLSRSEVEAVLEEYSLALEYLLRQGYSVHTSLMKLDVSIKGKFRNEKDRFHPRRHKLRLNITPGKRLRKLLKGETAYRIEPSAPHPCITGLAHFEPQQAKHQIRPAMLLSLSGHRLKVNPEAEDEGIYLRNEQRQEQKIQQLVTNTPSQLVFLLPADLPAATYALQLRCRVGNSTELRQDTYSEPLYCQPSAASE